MEDQHDQQLWQFAKKIAGFKQNLFTYLFVNIVLWIIWWFTHKSVTDDKWPWPLWATLIWGLFILLNYFEVYTGADQYSRTEQEYQKLKQKQEKS